MKFLISLAIVAIIVMMLMMPPTQIANASKNGCGPQLNMTLIDSADIFQAVLNGVGLGDFTTCCNAHDVCYSKPNCYSKDRDDCDDAFEDCMNDVCSKFGYLNRIKCKLTGSLLYKSVKKFGQKYFCIIY